MEREKRENVCVRERGDREERVRGAPVYVFLASSLSSLFTSRHTIMPGVGVPGSERTIEPAGHFQAVQPTLISRYTIMPLARPWLPCGAPGGGVGAPGRADEGASRRAKRRTLLPCGAPSAAKVAFKKSADDRRCPTCIDTWGVGVGG